MNEFRKNLPGLWLSVGFAFFSISVINFVTLFNPKSVLAGISPISLALIIGLLFSGLVRRWQSFSPGLSFAFKNLTKFAAVILGFRLSLSEVLHIGADGVFYILLSMICVFTAGHFIGQFFKLPKKLIAMITMGTAICGVSAILATSAALESEKEETSVAVAVISVFGFLGFIFYPFIANFLFSSSERSVGILLGIGIHDTAQVLGSSLMYEQMYQAVNVLDVSIVIKLIRNLFLIFALPLVIYQCRVSVKNTEKKSITKLVPLFIYLFLLAAVLRTWGDLNDSLAFGFLPTNIWQKFLENTDSFATFLLTAATAAIGLELNISSFIRHRLKPMLLGFVVALIGGASAMIALGIHRL